MRARRRPDRRRVQEFADAGFDELYLAQIGDRQAEFFAMLKTELLPRFR